MRRNFDLYGSAANRLLGGQVARIPSYTAKPYDIETQASARYKFATKMVEALTAKAQENREKEDMAAHMAALSTKFDPSAITPLAEDAPYLSVQREDMAQALAGTPQSPLGGSADNVFEPQAMPVDGMQPSSLGVSADDVLLPATGVEPFRFIDPSEGEDGAAVDAGQRALFGSDPASNPAMQAALLGAVDGDVGTRAEDEAAYMAEQYRNRITPREAVRNLTPQTKAGRDAQYAYELSQIERDQALVDERREQQFQKELKAIGPTTAGAKPGTPYEVNGRMVQDYIDASGNWAKRDVGAAAEFQYSSRPGVALQYEQALTDLKARIRAEEARDPNSPQLPILRERLTDLESTIARSLSYLGSVAKTQALEGARGETQEEREANMRGIRRGIQTKHDRLPILQSNIDEMKELSERFWTSGTLGRIAGVFPESAQYELNERKKNIASAVGLQELIDVKAQGATFGSLTENEMELLISSVGNLNTLLDPEVLGETLDNIIRLYAKGLATSKREFAELYPDVERTWETKENVIEFDSEGNIIE